jgi:hypothetical protein
MDKELMDRLAMDFLVHSSEAAAYSPSDAAAYSEAAACYEAVVYSPCEAVAVHPSSEAVGQSGEVVDHNY